MDSLEYSAIEIRTLLQELFPHRRLVLSQFTSFQHSGVAKATGATFRRGRRCYVLQDILPIACVLALKEEGIPYKNIEPLPALLQAHAEKIFAVGNGCLLSGFGDEISLVFPGENTPNSALDLFLKTGGETMQLFWSFNVGLLADQLRQVAESKAAASLIEKAA